MPDWQEPIRRRLVRTPLDPAREAEITEELSSHLDDRYRELTASGMSAADALRAVESELETLAIPPRPRREPLPVGGGGRPGVLAGVGHDLRVAARMARSKPAFSSAVVFMLAVGIAGNAAIFSVFNGLFLRPLPFPSPAGSSTWTRPLPSGTWCASASPMPTTPRGRRAIRPSKAWRSGRPSVEA